MKRYRHLAFEIVTTGLAILFGLAVAFFMFGSFLTSFWAPPR
jgi:hypothetical protein